MPCSGCGQSGHNIRTCGRSGGGRSVSSGGSSGASPSGHNIRTCGRSGAGQPVSSGGGGGSGGLSDMFSVPQANNFQEHRRQACSYCRTPGHNITTCAQKQADEVPLQKCSYCREPGHNIRTCSRKKAEDEKAEAEQRRRMEEQERLRHQKDEQERERQKAHQEQLRKKAEDDRNRHLAEQELRHRQAEIERQQREHEEMIHMAQRQAQVKQERQEMIHMAQRQAQKEQERQERIHMAQRQAQEEQERQEMIHMAQRQAQEEQERQGMIYIAQRQAQERQEMICMAQRQAQEEQERQCNDAEIQRKEQIRMADIRKQCQDLEHEEQRQDEETEREWMRERQRKAAEQRREAEKCEQTKLKAKTKRSKSKSLVQTTDQDLHANSTYSTELQYEPHMSGARNEAVLTDIEEDSTSAGNEQVSEEEEAGGYVTPPSRNADNETTLGPNGPILAQSVAELKRVMDLTKATKVNAVRGKELSSLYNAYKRRTFNASNRLAVIFMDDPPDKDYKTEGAEDQGGPARELLSLCLEQVAKEDIFYGPSESRQLQNTHMGFDKDCYKFVGTLFAMSIVHGGPAPTFLGPYAISKILRTNYKKTVNDVSNEIFRQLIKELITSQTEEEIEKCYNKLIENDLSRSMIGLVQMVKTKQDRAKVLPKLLMAGVEQTTAMAYEQFLEGLSSLGVLKEARKSPGVYRPCFEYKQDSINEDMMAKLFEKVQYTAEIGSTRRKEEATRIAWLLDLFLNMPEEMTYEEIIMFCTGSKGIPPAGFNPPITVSFRHRIDQTNLKDTDKFFSRANTCGNVLLIAVDRMHTFDEFCREFETSIVGGNTAFTVTELNE